jgi:hypothetical protein
MVKSRRSASAIQSRPNATLALRPNVSVSSRSVVISNGCASTTSVTVPWSMPVGTLLMPAALARRITSWGNAVVAISMSPIGIFNSALRTAPPTTRASSPLPFRSSSTRAVGPDLSQGASSALIPKFAGMCGNLLCELRNQRSTGKIYNCSAAFRFEVPDAKSRHPVQKLQIGGTAGYTRIAHFSTPGTNLPFSMCAGM